MSERPLWRLVAGKTTGPYVPAKLRPLVKDGRISPLDRFSYDGVTWEPAGSFPELLRDPPPPDPPEEEQFGVDLSDDASDVDNFDVSMRSKNDEDVDDESTRRLMEAVKWIAGIGGGLIVLMVILTVFTAFSGSQKPSGTSRPRSTDTRPGVKAAAAASVSPTAASDASEATERQDAEDVEADGQGAGDSAVAPEQNDGGDAA